MKGHLITQTRVRPRMSSLFHTGFTEQLAVRRATAREHGRTASLKTWLSASGYTQDSAIFPSALGRLHQKLTPALSPHRHRDSYATGSPREAPITENFSKLTGRDQDFRESIKYGLNLASKEIKSFLFIPYCGDQQPRQTAAAGFNILWLFLSSEPPTSFQK